MSTPATQKDVANKAGVDRSTVSRALNNDPRVAEETRVRVQKIAEQMGYRPNTSSQALAKQRYTHVMANETAAYIAVRLPYPTEEQLTRYNRADNRILQHLIEAAEKYNLKLEPHQVHTQKELKHLSHVLYHRGIRGVIFAPNMQPWAHDSFEWDKFISICVTPNYAPPAHRVSFDVGQSILNAYEPTFGSGYKRVAFAFHIHDMPIQDDQMRLAMLHYVQHEKAKCAIPLLKYTFDQYRRVLEGEPKALKAFERWLSKHQPQALIGFNHILYYVLTHHLGWKIPDDIAFAQLIAVPKDSNPLELSGNLDHFALMAEMTIKVLINQIHANAYGLPPYFVDMKITTEWHTGRTLPPLAQ